jgi:hypothetical protein
MAREARLLQDADELLYPAVAATIHALEPLDARDSGTAKLALRYARDIDRAELVAAQLEKVLRQVAGLDIDVYDRLLPLAVKIERTAVLATLGPKLLAALEQLGATPIVRSGKGDGGGGKPAGQLQALRTARR